MGNGDLPNGWKLRKIDDLYETIGGGTPSTAIPEYWEGNIPWITSADIAGLKDIRPRKYITEEAVTNSATNLAPAGSLIVVTRVSLGKVALTKQPLCFSQDSQALIAKDDSVLPEYALYYLSEATQIFKYQSRGTTISGVTKKQLKELPFPLPPLPEQERIVAKIEELFTQLEAGTAALERVHAGLKRYKASVLKVAVEGKLGIQSIEFRMQDDGLLPAGWKWSTIEEACERIVDCLHSTPKFTESGNYCVDSNWIKPGIFVFEKARFVDNETFIERNRRMKPRANDVVFSREGALLGVAVRVPENFEFCLGQRMMIFRPQDFLESKYLEYFLNSQSFRSQYAPLITGTAAPHLNIGDIRGFQIPLPPLEEQRQIVAEVERQLSLAAEVESTLAASLSRAGRLRQSVLKSAFEGRLV